MCRCRGRPGWHDWHDRLPAATLSGRSRESRSHRQPFAPPPPARTPTADGCVATLSQAIGCLSLESLGIAVPEQHVRVPPKLVSRLWASISVTSRTRRRRVAALRCRLQSMRAAGSQAASAEAQRLERWLLEHPDDPPQQELQQTRPPESPSGATGAAAAAAAPPSAPAEATAASSADNAREVAHVKPQAAASPAEEASATRRDPTPTTTVSATAHASGATSSGA